MNLGPSSLDREVGTFMTERIDLVDNGSVPIDSIEDVRVFRQVVASGGISAAARTMNDSKNRISQRLAALEGALGVRLADRTTRSLRLTEDGERFLAASEALVEAADRSEAAVARKDALEGRVRVAVRSALSGVGIGDGIARLLHGTPKLRLQIVVVDDEADLGGLQAQGVDLAVQVGALRDSSLVARRLGNVSFAMCATPGYLREYGRPRTPSDLHRHECIRRLGAVTETTWALVGRTGRRVAARLGGRLECSDARFQAEVLYGGFGIGLRPAAEVRRAAQAGTLEPVLPTWSLAPISVWVVAPKGRLRLPRVEKMVELLTRVVVSLS